MRVQVKHHKDVYIFDCDSTRESLLTLIEDLKAKNDNPDLNFDAMDAADVAMKLGGVPSETFFEENEDGTGG